MRDEVTDLLLELVAWTKLQARDALVSGLTEALSTDNDRRVYELTDGSRTGADVAREVGVSRQAVSQKWKTWRQMGLILDSPDDAGPRHLASLESLGWVN
jgi:biotin operon repressor